MTRTGAIPAAGTRRYPGVQAFKDNDVQQLLFQGRDQESQQLYHLVASESLVLLFGRSGFGKSSLINAGLLPRLRDRGFFPVIVRINDGDRDPIDMVREQFIHAARNSDIEYTHGPLHTSWHYFKKAEFIRDGHKLTPVIIVDQFEEVFTLQSADNRARFVRELSNIARGRRPRTDLPIDDELDDQPPRVQLVLSMREDFLAEASELSTELPQILKSRFRLGALSRDAARQAIEGPAAVEARGLGPPFTWSPEALETTLDFLSKRRTRHGIVIGNEIEPFQLQMVCQRAEESLFERTEGRPVSGPLVVEPADLGSLDELLLGFYRSTLKAVAEASVNGRSIPLLKPLQARQAQRRLETMVEDGLISGAGRRLSQEKSELSSRYKVRGDTLVELTHRRLLRQESRTGDDYYELSHDTLITPVLSERAQRLKQRRQRQGVSGILLLIVALVTTLYLYPRYRDGESVEQARFYLDNVDDPATAQYLLLQARHNVEGWMPTASDILSRRIPDQTVYFHSGGIRSQDFSPDGSLLVTGSMAGNAIISTIDPETKNLDRVTTLGHESLVRIVAFSRNTSEWIATGTADGVISLWPRRMFASASENVVHCTTPCVSIATGRAIRDLSFSETEPLLVAASDDGFVRVIDLRSADAITSWEFTANGGVRLVGFGPEGQVVANSGGALLVWDDAVSGVLDQTLELRRTPRTEDGYTARLVSGLADHRLESVGTMNQLSFLDDRRLLVVRRGGGAYVWNYRTNAFTLLRPDFAVRDEFDFVDAPAEDDDAYRIQAAAIQPLGGFFLFLTIDNAGAIELGGYDPDIDRVDPALVPVEMEHPGDGQLIAAYLFENDFDISVLTARSDGSIRWFPDVNRLGAVDFIEISHPGLIQIGLSPDERTLITSSLDGSIRRWDLLDLRTDDVVTNPLLTLLASTPLFNADSTAMLADLGDGVFRTYQRDEDIRELVDVDVSREGILTAGGLTYRSDESGHTALGRQGRLVARIRGGAERGAEQIVVSETASESERIIAAPFAQSVEFSQDDRYLIVSTGDMLMSFDLSESETPAATVLAEEAFQGYAMHPTRDQVVIITDLTVDTRSPLATVTVVDLDGGAQDSTQYEDTVVDATFMGDGSHLLVNLGDGARSTTEVWSLTADNRERLWPRGGVNAVAVNRNHRRIVLAAYDGVWIYSVPQLAELGTTPGTADQIDHVAFDPTSDRLLTVNDRSASVWRQDGDTYPADRALHIRLPAADLISGEFTPDGRAVVLRFDNSVWLWDVNYDAMRYELELRAGCGVQDFRAGMDLGALQVKPRCITAASDARPDAIGRSLLPQTPPAR